MVAGIQNIIETKTINFLLIAQDVKRELEKMNSFNEFVIQFFRRILRIGKYDNCYIIVIRLSKMRKDFMLF